LPRNGPVWDLSKNGTFLRLYYFWSNGSSDRDDWSATFCPLVGHFSIVMDNTGWNAVKASTLRVYREGEAKEASEFESKLAPKAQFTKVAEAFGAYGEGVSDPADVPAAIARCLKEVRGGRAALLLARVTKM
jgi:hypothetical protein